MFDFYQNYVYNIHIMRKEVRKSKLCSLIFPILCKGIIGAYKYDDIVKQELDTLPQNFSISLGVMPNGSYIRLIRENGKFYTTKEYAPSDLEITFKNSSSAKATMLARQNIGQAYAKHQILLAGDISQGLTLVRVINRVECYLFPRFMTKNILPKIRKKCCTLKLYCYILFAKTKYKGTPMEVQ